MWMDSWTLVYEGQSRSGLRVWVREELDAALLRPGDSNARQLNRYSQKGLQDSMCGAP